MSVGRGSASPVSGRRESLLLYEGPRSGRGGAALPPRVSDLTLRRADAEAVFHTDQCIRETFINIFAFLAVPFVYLRGGCAGVRNRYFYPDMFLAWLQYSQCAAMLFLVIMSIVSTSAKGVPFAPTPFEVTSATALYVLRCVTIGIKYGFFARSQYQDLDERTYSARELYDKLILAGWSAPNPALLYTELEQAAIRRSPTLDDRIVVFPTAKARWNALLVMGESLETFLEAEEQSLSPECLHLLHNALAEHRQRAFRGLGTGEDVGGKQYTGPQMRDRLDQPAKVDLSDVFSAASPIATAALLGEMRRVSAATPPASTGPQAADLAVSGAPQVRGRSGSSTARGARRRQSVMQMRGQVEMGAGGGGGGGGGGVRVLAPVPEREPPAPADRDASATAQSGIKLAAAWGKGGVENKYFFRVFVVRTAGSLLPALPLKLLVWHLVRENFTRRLSGHISGTAVRVATIAYSVLPFVVRALIGRPVIGESALDAVGLLMVFVLTYINFGTNLGYVTSGINDYIRRLYVADGLADMIDPFSSRVLSRPSVLVDFERRWTRAAAAAQAPAQAPAPAAADRRGADEEHAEYDTDEDGDEDGDGDGGGEGGGAGARGEEDDMIGAVSFLERAPPAPAQAVAPARGGGRVRSAAAVSKQSSGIFAVASPLHPQGATLSSAAAPAVLGSVPEAETADMEMTEVDAATPMQRPDVIPEPTVATTRQRALARAAALGGEELNERVRARRRKLRVPMMIADNVGGWMEGFRVSMDIGIVFNLRIQTYTSLFAIITLIIIVQLLFGALGTVSSSSAGGGGAGAAAPDAAGQGVRGMLHMLATNTDAATAVLHGIVLQFCFSLAVMGQILTGAALNSVQLRLAQRLTRLEEALAEVQHELESAAALDDIPTLASAGPSAASVLGPMDRERARAHAVRHQLAEARSMCALAVRAIGAEIEYRPARVMGIPATTALLTTLVSASASGLAAAVQTLSRQS